MPPRRACAPKTATTARELAAPYPTRSCIKFIEEAYGKEAYSEVLHSKQPCHTFLLAPTRSSSAANPPIVRPEDFFGFLRCRVENSHRRGDGSLSVCAGASPAAKPPPPQAPPRAKLDPAKSRHIEVYPRDRPPMRVTMELLGCLYDLTIRDAMESLRLTDSGFRRLREWAGLNQWPRVRTWPLHFVAHKLGHVRGERVMMMGWAVDNDPFAYEVLHEAHRRAPGCAVEGLPRPATDLSMRVLVTRTARCKDVGARAPASIRTFSRPSVKVPVLPHGKQGSFVPTQAMAVERALGVFKPASEPARDTAEEQPGDEPAERWGEPALCSDFPDFDGELSEFLGGWDDYQSPVGCRGTPGCYDGFDGGVNIWSQLAMPEVN
jgi:hypothetical protein